MRVKAHLETGGLIVHPTETVYGVGGAATAAGVTALRNLKGSSAAKSFLLLFGDSESLARCTLDWSAAARALATRFWPGPLTLILGSVGSQLPADLRGASGGVAVRHTSHKPLARLLALLGEPITSSSANRSGEPPAASAQSAGEVFAREIASGELLLMDGGVLRPSPPSTVVDCTVKTPRIVRHGALSATELRGVVPELTE
jgi:L-threonylcarbamoyladenylate synthase